LLKVSRNIAFFVLVLSVFSLNSVEFFHHHENDSLKDDSNCQACLLTSVLGAIDIGDATVAIITPTQYQLFTLNEYSIPVSESHRTSQGRAPPVNTIL